MNQEQQEEALEYFKKHASDWREKAETDTKNEVNVIKERNDFVIKVVNERENIGQVLDVGCGTGDLVCRIAESGISATGVDFAEEMINEAKDNASGLQLNKAKFKHANIFDYSYQKEEYDVVSANGFIEYISYQELDDFLTISYKALKPGGSLVLGSRNRLFNIFSLNDYTREEISGQYLNSLVSEAIKIIELEDIKELVGLETAPLQKEEKKHKHTGIGVSTRYQFTPAQLINLLKDKGFSPIELCPIHIHGTPPAFKDKHPKVHGNISNLLKDYTHSNVGLALIPQSSSFMLHVKKVKTEELVE